MEDAVYGVENMLEAVLAVKDNYARQIPPWVKWMQETGHGIDEEGIRAYFAYLLNDSGYAAGSIRVKRHAIKSRVLSALENNDDAYDKAIVFFNRLDRKPFTKAPSKKWDAVRKSNILSHIEWEEMQKACHSARQRAFVRFLYATGCRVAELCSARLAWCDVGPSAVKIRIIGKGKKERFIRIQRELFDYIRATFNGSEYLFETSKGRAYHPVYVSSQVRAIAKRINKRLSPNSFRHTFATRMVEEYPHKLDAISSYMGHTSPAFTVGTYVHTELDDDEILSIGG